MKDELDVLIDLLSVREVLRAVTSADDVMVSKPDPEVFLKAIQSAGLDPKRSIAVGDSVWDIKGAAAAGLACIALESGGSSRHELAEAGPPRSIETRLNSTINSNYR